MGFLDTFKRKSTDVRPARNMEMKFLYECPRCSKEKAMRFEIPLVEDDKHVYTQWVGQSSSPNLVKLPLVNMKVDNQSKYLVEKISDRLDDGNIVPLSDERWKEIGFVIKCTYCVEETRFILGACVITNTEGKILLQKISSQEVYEFPIVLLKSDGQGNLSVVAFLNPISEAREANKMAVPETHEDQDKRLLDDQDKIVRERAAEILSESNSAIQSNPNDVEAYYKRSLAYFLEHDYESSLKALNKAIELDHDYTPAITKRGLIYVIKKKYNLAMKDFNIAIELNPGYSPAYLNRGICYYEMGNTDLAQKDLNKVLEISSEQVLIKQAKQYSVLCKRTSGLRECEKGIAHIDNRQYDEAITELKRVIESNPSNASAYFYLGMAYDNQENYDLAVAALDKAIELDHEFPGAYNNRGWVYLKTAHYTRAIADFSKEIEFNASFVAVYLNRANAYHNIGEPGLAIPDLNKALELSSDPRQIEKIKRQIEAIQYPEHYPDVIDLQSAEDYNKRGADYYLKQKYKLAIADFTKALELDPTFSAAYHNRGLAFRDDRQYASAILNFNKAIELRPDSIAYFNRGLVYSDIGNYDLSIADFSKAIELDKNFARAYYERSGSYYCNGKHELSLRDLDKVIELSDDNKLIQLAAEAKRNMESKMS